MTMKVLNLYAGIGGNRLLWDNCDVTAVEMNPDVAEIYQDFFPNDTVIVGDAHQYLLDHYKEFDFIWSSPPCTTHTRINKNFGFVRYADMKLYQEIIFLKTWFDGKFCVENVIPYYGQEGLIISDLPVQQYYRHLFWCNYKIRTTDKRNPPKQINIKAQKSKDKTFIKNDDTESLSKLLGMPHTDKKVYVDGNHSPGQIYRNCVNPKVGSMVFNTARGIHETKPTQQTNIFDQGA